MEIRTSQEAKENIEKFTKRYANLMQQKKDLMDDIKALKDEFKEDGVPVGVVTKIFNRIKANKKKTESQIFEEECIQTWLEESPEIDDLIGMLNAK